MIESKLNSDKIARLKILFILAQEYTDRYDIAQSVYDDLILECTQLDQYITANLKEFGTSEEASKLINDCKYATFLFMIRVTEMLENNSR